MAELVDALDSKPSILRCAGSIPALGTNPPKYRGVFISKILQVLIEKNSLGKAIQEKPPSAHE